MTEKIKTTHIARICPLCAADDWFGQRRHEMDLCHEDLPEGGSRWALICESPEPHMVWSVVSDRNFEEEKVLGLINGYLDMREKQREMADKKAKEMYEGLLRDQMDQRLAVRQLIHTRNPLMNPCPCGCLMRVEAEYPADDAMGEMHVRLIHDGPECVLWHDNAPHLPDDDRGEIFTKTRQDVEELFDWRDNMMYMMADKARSWARTGVWVPESYRHKESMDWPAGLRLMLDAQADARYNQMYELVWKEMTERYEDKKKREYA